MGLEPLKALTLVLVRGRCQSNTRKERNQTILIVIAVETTMFIGIKRSDFMKQTVTYILHILNTLLGIIYRALGILQRIARWRK